MPSSRCAIRVRRCVLLSLLCLLASILVTAAPRKAQSTDHPKRSYTLSGTIRDFRPRTEKDGHPDFEVESDGHTVGHVDDELDRDGKPEFEGRGRRVERQWRDRAENNIPPWLYDRRRGDRPGRYAERPSNGGVTSARSFAQWFRDVNGVNQATEFEIEFLYDARRKAFAYDHKRDPRLKNRGGFFPIDGKLLGNGREKHNFHFTYELSAEFHYHEKDHPFITVEADDDCWVFIDGRLVLELGGLRSAEWQTVSLNRLPLKNDRTYRLDLFFAERHTGESQLWIETNLELQRAKPRHAKPAQLAVRYDSPADLKLPAVLRPSLVLVVDSSHSMACEESGKSRLDVAREAARVVLDKLPADMQIGLRLLGHRGIWILRKDDPQAEAVSVYDPRLCEDTELLVGVAPLTHPQRSNIDRILDWAEPRGETPLVRALLEAERDLGSATVAPRNVLMLSDGGDTCGADLRETLDRLSEIEGVITLRVVGVGTDAISEAELRKAAKDFGGEYQSLGDLAALAEGLAGQVPTSPAFEVLDKSGKQILARGVLGGKPLSLPAGVYQVRLVGPSVKPIVVELRPGQATTLHAQDDGSLTAR